jgi:hypothetical protein
MADHKKVIYDTEKGVDQAGTGIKQDYSRKLSLNDRRNQHCSVDCRRRPLRRPLRHYSARPRISTCVDDRLGATIGTDLFVSSGQALALGGAAFVLVSYITIAILVYSIATAITEVAT